MSRRIVSVDVETTGTDPRLHEAWEVAVVPLNGERHHYHFPLSKLPVANPTALEIGGFYERFTYPEGQAAHDLRAVHFHAADEVPYNEISGLDAALEVAKATAGATLLGCSVHFDAAFLQNLLVTYGLAPGWHHRFLDLGSFAAGAWSGDHPLSSKAMQDRLPNADAHNAYADACWNLEVYRSIVGSQLSG